MRAYAGARGIEAPDREGVRAARTLSRGARPRAGRPRAACRRTARHAAEVPVRAGPDVGDADARGASRDVAGGGAQAHRRTRRLDDVACHAAAALRRPSRQDRARAPACVFRGHAPAAATLGHGAVDAPRGGTRRGGAPRLGQGAAGRPLHALGARAVRTRDGDRAAGVRPRRHAAGHDRDPRLRQAAAHVHVPEERAGAHASRHLRSAGARRRVAGGGGARAELP